MHQPDYSQSCTKIWDPAFREAPYEVISIRRCSAQFRAARGKTKPTYLKATTSGFDWQ